MGSGKSTVGRALARRLGWTFLDIDEVVTAREGRSISRVFQDEGEAYFRLREHEATMEQLGRDRVVIATGGGWPAAPGRLEGLGPDSCSVWLDVAEDELERRLRGSGSSRPMLSGTDARERIAELLEARVPFYGRARIRVDAGADPEAVAERVIAILGGLTGPIDEPRTEDLPS